MPPKETKDKAQLEILWQGASRFAKQCRDDHLQACKEFGRNSSVAQGTWKRFLRADKERKDAEREWEAG